MSASHVGMANLRPFTGGPDPRRNVQGAITVAERQFWRDVEQKCYPRALEMLDVMITRGIAGNDKCAMVAFKVMGLIRKQTDNAAIVEMAQKMLDLALESARARRAANGGG